MDHSFIDGQVGIPRLTSGTQAPASIVVLPCWRTLHGQRLLDFQGIHDAYAATQRSSHLACVEHHVIHYRKREPVTPFNGKECGWQTHAACFCGDFIVTVVTSTSWCHGSKLEADLMVFWRGIAPRGRDRSVSKDVRYGSLMLSHRP